MEYNQRKGLGLNYVDPKSRVPIRRETWYLRDQFSFVSIIRIKGGKYLASMKVGCGSISAESWEFRSSLPGSIFGVEVKGSL